MTTTTRVRLCAPARSADLVAFVNEQKRLPRVDDARAASHYRGWVLPYVMLIHELCPSVAR
ncbi:MAG: hypothetical protein EXR98_11915 [Gemmataceae bacterium]|nr:hypothetical protein [Gemmataceae bacterium]